jgi:hypothetical protein
MNENRNISIHAHDAIIPVRAMAYQVALMASYSRSRKPESWVYSHAESYIAESFFGKPFDALSEDDKDSIGGLVGEFVRSFLYKTSQLNRR